jgi:DNA-binding XRE family transcriptional regulator
MPPKNFYPYTMSLGNGVTVYVEVPASMVRKEDGEIAFTPAGIRFLDRVRAAGTPIGETMTPGHIAALRAALGMTQEAFGKAVGVNKLTVSRWERGELRPNRTSLAAIRQLRRKQARQGVAIVA